MAWLAARAAAADDAAAWQGAALQARVKIGAALRQALAQIGIDPAAIAMLRICDDAARELALSPGPLEAGAPPPAGDLRDDASAEAFGARIARSMRRCRDRPGLDFAQASLAEALAWCLERLQSAPSMTRGTAEETGARRFCC